MMPASIRAIICWLSLKPDSTSTPALIAIATRSPTGLSSTPQGIVVAIAVSELTLPSKPSFSRNNSVVMPLENDIPTSFGKYFCPTGTP